MGCIGGMEMFKELWPFMDAEKDVGSGTEKDAEEVVQDAQEIKVDDSEQIVEESKDSDKVPLATMLEERKRRKEVERQLREIQEKQIDSDVKLTKAQLKQKYIDKGVDEDVAEAFADEFANIKAEVKKASFKELENSSVEEDLKDMSKDAFFSDALTYKKEIINTLNTYRAKGIDLSLEDAYIKVRGKSRLNEYKTEIEQKALNNRRNVEEKGIPAAKPTSPKDPYPLDEADKKALAGLQKAQPQAGWDAKKYYTMMKG
jgi:hypothetical protein